MQRTNVVFITLLLFVVLVVMFTRHQIRNRFTNLKIISNTAQEDQFVPIMNITKVNVPKWYTNALSIINATVPFDTCEVPECRFVNEEHINTSDAILFFERPNKPPHYRGNSDQIWIFSTWESPPHSRGASVFSKPEWHNQINWTMTYRWDSDIPVMYGNVRKIKSSPKNYTAIMDRKTKTVAWAVSNCGSRKRMEYAKILNESIPIDIFGRCGKRKIDSTTFQTINETYKFYLSFENSYCKDYVTEKFFDRQNFNVVLIVMGAANYSHLYPKNSYIDIRDFKSAKQLGEYLQYLNKNETAYTNYIKAKEGYISDPFNISIQNGVCQMCKMLHAKVRKKKVYNNIYEWHAHDTCKVPAT